MIFHFAERTHYERQYDVLANINTTSTNMNDIEHYILLKNHLKYHNRWTFSHSAYFALNIASTIGSSYSPQTHAGKWLAMFFALISIPLFLASATFYTGFFLGIPSSLSERFLEFELQSKSMQLLNLMQFTIANCAIVAFYFSMRFNWTFLDACTNIVETFLTLGLGLVPTDNWTAFDFITAFHFHLSAVGACMLLLGILSDNITKHEREILNEAILIINVIDDKLFHMENIEDIAEEKSSIDFAKLQDVVQKIADNDNFPALKMMKSHDIIKTIPNKIQAVADMGILEHSL